MIEFWKPSCVRHHGHVYWGPLPSLLNPLQMLLNQRKDIYLLGRVKVVKKQDIRFDGIVVCYTENDSVANEGCDLSHTLEKAEQRM